MSWASVRPSRVGSTGRSEDSLMPIRRAFNSNFDFSAPKVGPRCRPGQTRPDRDQTRRKPIARPVRQARAGDCESLSFFGESEHSLDRQIATCQSDSRQEVYPLFCFALLCLCLIPRDAFKFALNLRSSVIFLRQPKSNSLLAMSN